MGINLFDNTFNAIEKNLDLRMRRHTVLSSNIANNETPNYKARELDFAGELQRALGNNPSELKRTDSKHMDVGAFTQAHVILDQTSPVGADGNNVDLDIAMGKLATNGKAYSSAADYLNMKLRLIRFAASGGRGGI